MDQYPIDQDGNIPTGDDIEAVEDYILCIMPDDHLVHVDCRERVRVGAAGTGEHTGVTVLFHWRHEEPWTPGTYELIKGYWPLVRKLKQERIDAGLPWKVWYEYAEILPYQIMTEKDLCAEVIEMGVQDFLEMQTQ